MAGPSTSDAGPGATSPPGMAGAASTGAAGETASRGMASELAEAPGPKAAISWTAGTVLQTIGVFIAAGLAEIGGGWLVWQTLRNSKPWYYFLGGALVLVAYGVIPTLQPEGATFSRVYAVYGGIFVVMSYAWGWVVDGDRPDRGDIVGGSIALAGVAVAWFWPRS